MSVFPPASGSLPSRLQVLNLRHYGLLAYWVIFKPSALHRYFYDADPELYPRLGWHKIVKSWRIGAYRSLYGMTAIAIATALSLLLVLVPMAFAYNLQGHTSGIAAIAVTPDQQLAISASTDRRIRSFVPNSDRTLKVWNLRRGTEKFTLQGHNKSVSTVTVTPDSRKAISGGYDTLVQAWDLQTGKRLYTINGHERWINDLAVTPDNKLALSASADGTLRVWDVESGEVLYVLEGHEDEINGVAVTPDGQRAISASRDRTLKVWDLTTGSLLQTLAGHEKSVNGVVVTSDNQGISASNDRTLKVWDLTTGSLLQTLAGHEDAVNLVAIASDNRVVSAAQDGTLKVWDLNTGEAIHTLMGHQGWISDLAIAQDRIISASSDHTLKVWDINTGQELYTLTGHQHRVQAVTAIPEEGMAISVSYDRFPQLWNLASGRPQVLMGATIQRDAIAFVLVTLAVLAAIATILAAMGCFAVSLAWFGVYGTLAIALILSFIACGIYTGIAVFIDRLVTHPSFRNFSEALLLSRSLLIAFGLIFGLLVNIGLNLANRKTLAAFWAVIFTICIAITASIVVASVIQRPANSLRAPVVRAWRTGIRVGFWFNLLVLAGSLRLPFYPVHLLLSAASYWRKRLHPIYWDETVVLPLPGTTQTVKTQLDRDPQHGLAFATQVAANPWQRPGVQRALIHHLHRTDAPLFWLHSLLNDSDLDRYCYAPVMPKDWRDFPSARLLLLGEIAGVSVTVHGGSNSRLSDKFVNGLTGWQRIRKNTPLTQFAGVLYGLLQEDLPQSQLLGSDRLYPLLEAYPGGVEIHQSFDLMAKFLSYRDLDGIASAVDLVGLEAFVTLLKEPDLAIRPQTIGALKCLSEVAAQVARAQASPDSELQGMALTQGLAMLTFVRSQVISTVTAPDSTLLLRIIDQWQEIIAPHVAQPLNNRES